MLRIEAKAFRIYGEFFRVDGEMYQLPITFNNPACKIGHLMTTLNYKNWNFSNSNFLPQMDDPNYEMAVVYNVAVYTRT